MAQILIVYYSRSGNTQRMAELVAEGVRQGGAAARVQAVEQVALAELLEVDGLILGSPTYYGSMAAEIKRFIDESVKLHGRLVGKIGGAFSSSGSLAGGNETAILDMLKALLVHGMIVPGCVDGDHYGPVAVGAPDARSAAQCHQMGRIVAQLAGRLAAS
ncbi:MAG: flavodoxin family protein [Lentisphaerae bacterium]|nr:flavodoxin family protein [Lentisphaerota bacterium]